MVDLNEYIPFFKGLDEIEKVRVRAGLRELSFASGDVVHTADECSGLIVVVSGQLKASALTEAGREINLFRLFSHDVCIFSASCMMRNLDFDVHVQAVEDTEILLLPTKIFSSLADGNIHVLKFMNDIISSRMSDVMWLMDQVLNKKMDTRLAALLVDEARITGSDTIGLTHEELARHLGTAREVVSRTLGYLQKEGEVRLTRGKIAITDMAALESRAEESLR